MNTLPPNQHEALSQEELVLARVVRALPGGEPPAALDALILKAASDAVASQPDRKSLWKKGFLGSSALWLGTAAASILTVGLGLQVFQSMRAPIYELPAGENVSSKQVTDSSQKSESIAVEMIPAREPLPTSAPPPSQAAAATDAPADTIDSFATQAKPKKAMPERQERKQNSSQILADVASAKDSKEEYRRSNNNAAESDWVSPSASAAVETAQVGAAGALAAVPAPAAPAPMVAAASADKADDAALKEIETVAVTGSRIARTDGEQAQPLQTIGLAKKSSRARLQASVAIDSKLAPELWLNAIRQRYEDKDIAGANESLKNFKKKYPKLPIPNDLKTLLK